MAKLRFSACILALFIIFSVGMISANYLVTGTVYDGNPSYPKSGVGVTITCDSNILTTTSLSDGTYAVVFGVDSCSAVNVVPDSYSATKIKMYVDPSAYTPPSGGGGGGSTHKYYNCGNNVCDTGETSLTCAKDCPVQTTNLSTSTNQSTEKETETKVTDTKTETPTNKGLLGLTGGAITDFAQSGAGIGTMAGILVLVIIIFLVARKKRSKKPEETKEETKE